MAANFPLAVVLDLVDKLSPKWARTDAKLRATGTAFQAWGKKLSVGVTAPIAAMGALATRAALQHETFLQQVQRVTSATAESVTAFGAAIFEQAKDHGWNVEQTRVAAGAAAREYRELANAAKALSPAMMLATATSNEGAASMKALLDVAGAYRKTVDDLPSLADALSRADQAFGGGPGTLEQLASAVEKLAPAAVKKGLSPVDVLGQMAAAKAGGLTIEQARKGLKNALGGGNDASKEMKRALAAAAAMGITPANVLGAFKPLESLQSNDFTKVAEATNRLVTSWQQLLVEAGNAGLIQTFTSLAESATKLISVFAQMPPGVQKSIVVTAALTAAAGPLLLTAGAVIKNVGWLKAGFSKLPAVLGFVRSALGAVRLAVIGVSVAARANPIGLLVTGLAAGAYFVIRNWELVKTKLGAAWDWLRAKFDATWGWILRQIDRVQEFFGFGDRATGAASAAAAPGVGAADPIVLAPSDAGVRQRAQITVDFRNTPRGTRVSTRGDAGFETNLGWAMPQVVGAR